MYIYLHCQNKNKKIDMETKITLQKNILTQNAIKVDEVTYRCNWANEKILEDEREEKTFNSLEELKSYVSTFTPLNQRLYREAKKKKLPYYLMKQLENK